LKKISSTDAHNFLRGFILLGLACLIAYLVLSGDVLLYVTPKLVIYLEFAGTGLFIVAAFQFYISIISLRRTVITCNCGHDHGEDHDDHDDHSHSHEYPRSIGANIIIYGLFLLPLVLGTLMPNTALAGSLAAKRGMNLGAYPPTIVLRLRI